jgi:hypothetical protein
MGRDAVDLASSPLLCRGAHRVAVAWAAVLDGRLGSSSCKKVTGLNDQEFSAPSTRYQEMAPWVLVPSGVGRCDENHDTGEAEDTGQGPTMTAISTSPVIRAWNARASGAAGPNLGVAARGTIELNRATAKAA